MKFKNILLTGLATLAFTALEAKDTQITPADRVATTLQQDSVAPEKLINPFTITSAYAGQITSIGFSTKDPSDISAYSSTRLGGGASYNMMKGVSLQMMGILDISPNQGDTYAFGQAFVRSNIRKQWGVSTGLVAVPATLLRPFPVDWTGHFETSTDALIPGGAVGCRVDKKGPLSASAGLALRKGTLEYGANVGYQGDDEKVNVAGWYQHDDVFGLALSGSYKACSGTLVWNETEDQSRIGAQVLYSFEVPGRTGSLALFAVANRDLAQPDNQMMNGSAGVLAVGEVQLGGVPVNIVIGSGYDAVNKSVVMYLQIALQK